MIHVMLQFATVLVHDMQYASHSFLKLFLIDFTSRSVPK